MQRIDLIIILSKQMINFSTKKGYSQINVQEQHKAEMSWQKLSGLLVLLAFIWILCYNAQLQFPARHISDTYDRIEDRNISQLSLKYAQKLLNRSKNAQQKQMDYFDKKYGFTKLRQQQICVILIHTQDLKQQKWMESVSILLQQDYANYKIYYINNYDGGQKIYSYIQQNSLNKEKIKLVDNIPNTDYAKQFDYAKNYCSLNSIVLYMYDEDQLIGRNVFASVNGIFQKNNDLNFFYSASLIPTQELKDGTWKYELGRSYPYPEQIVKQGKYYEYPFIVDGLVAFKAELFNRETNNLLSKGNQPYKKAGMVALGMSLLQSSKYSVKYFPEPLILKSKLNEYITLDQQLKAEIEQIYQKYKQ